MSKVNINLEQTGRLFPSSSMNSNFNLMSESSGMLAEPEISFSFDSNSPDEYWPISLFKFTACSWILAERCCGNLTSAAIQIIHNIRVFNKNERLLKSSCHRWQTALFSVSKISNLLS